MRSRIRGWIEAVAFAVVFALAYCVELALQALDPEEPPVGPVVYEGDERRQG